jgi:hypothetical protein
MPHSCFRHHRVRLNRGRLRLCPIATRRFFVSFLDLIILILTTDWEGVCKKLTVHGFLGYKWPLLMQVVRKYMLYYLPDFPLDTESVGPPPLAVFTTTTSRMAITFLLTPVTRSTGPTTSAPLHQHRNVQSMPSTSHGHALLAIDSCA